MLIHVWCLPDGWTGQKLQLDVSWTAEDFERDTMLVFPTDGGFPAILTIQLPPSLRELSQDSDKILQAGETLGKIDL